jgi:predicted small secreted protein
MSKISIVTILVASLALTACNTVRGLGDDLTSVADAVDDET